MTKHQVPPLPPLRDRLKALWGVLREHKIGEVADKVQFWLEAVAHGADPIEAAQGHLCGPHCWHWEFMSEEKKEQLRKAPWNRKETP